MIRVGGRITGPQVCPIFVLRREFFKKRKHANFLAVARGVVFLQYSNAWLARASVDRIDPLRDFLCVESRKEISYDPDRGAKGAIYDERRSSNERASRPEPSVLCGKRGPLQSVRWKREACTAIRGHELQCVSHLRRVQAFRPISTIPCVRRSGSRFRRETGKLSLGIGLVPSAPR